MSRYELFVTYPEDITRSYAHSEYGSGTEAEAWAQTLLTLDNDYAEVFIVHGEDLVATYRRGEISA
jgi:hypothetical protein